MATAKDRGAMILICLTLDNEAANDAQREVYKDPTFVKASADFVCLFACPVDEHGTTTVTVDGHSVKRCAVAPTIVCRDHLKAYNEVQKNYAEYNTDAAGNTRFPFHLVIDGKGKVLAEIRNGTKEGGFDIVPAPQFVAALKLLVDKFGKGVTADEYEEMKAKLAEAQKRFEAGDYLEALKLASAVLEINERTKLSEEAKKIRDTVAAQGRAEVKVAVELAEKDPVGAVVALEKIQSEYEGTIVEKEAKTELATLKRRPAVRKAMAEIEARKKAENALARAEKEISSENYYKALKILDNIAEDFPGTAVGDKAAARAKELRSDPEIAGIAKEQEAAKYCRGWLSLARSFAKNGMTDKARQKYQEIIDKFPGTSYAEEAAEELKKLR